MCGRLEGTPLNRSISGCGLGTDAALSGRGGSWSRRASLNILWPCQRESLGMTVLKGGLTFSSRVSPLRVLLLPNSDSSMGKTPLCPPLGRVESHFMTRHPLSPVLPPTLSPSPWAGRQQWSEAPLMRSLAARWADLLVVFNNARLFC